MEEISLCRETMHDCVRKKNKGPDKSHRFLEGSCAWKEGTKVERVLEGQTANLLWVNSSVGGGRGVNFYRLNSNKYEIKEGENQVLSSAQLLKTKTVQVKMRQSLGS